MNRERGCDTLGQFLKRLETEGELHRISVEVDPYLEVAEIAVRCMREGQKALLFENVRGSKFPLAMNILASDRRIELALGNDPGELGHQFISLVEQLLPPKPMAAFGAAKPLASRLFSSRVRRTSHEQPRHEIRPVDLGQLPILQTWPDDAGKFITLPQVVTYDPETHKRNMGMYRMQVFGANETGMHWQIQKGGGFHYHRAEQLGQPLNVAVAIGTDPALLLATIAPLPESIDEVAFAGFLRGRPTAMTKARTIGIDVPTNAEFLLEGTVLPEVRKLEGPFGDHFGHYSHEGMFPVFAIKAISHVTKPIFAATVVGKPPMEDKWLGDANQLVLGPLARLNHPELRDVWAFYEAGFHNLIGIAANQRYAKEAMKTALSVSTDGQLSLTKCAIVVDESVNNRSFRSLLQAIADHFDPHYDALILPNVPLDTLDFTSYSMNLGSKLLIDATRKMDVSASGGSYPKRLNNQMYELTGTNQGDFGDADTRIESWKVLENVLLVVKIRSGLSRLGEESVGREIAGKLIRGEQVRKLPKGTKIVAIVSEDVDLESEMEIVWGIFTRFDAARDIVFSKTTLAGATAVNEGIMGIDATWKKGYPKPCIMPEHIVNRVDDRWAELGFK